MDLRVPFDVLCKKFRDAGLCYYDTRQKQRKKSQL
jgi:hypothetical protein